MKVKVYLASLGDDSVLDGRKMLELEEGATLKTALKKLKIPLAVNHLPLIVVNHKREKFSRILKDGDVISVVGLFSGG